MPQGDSEINTIPNVLNTKTQSTPSYQIRQIAGEKNEKTPSTPENESKVPKKNDKTKQVLRSKDKQGTSTLQTRVSRDKIRKQLLMLLEHCTWLVTCSLLCPPPYPRGHEKGKGKGK